MFGSMNVDDQSSLETALLVIAVSALRVSLGSTLKARWVFWRELTVL